MATRQEVTARIVRYTHLREDRHNYLDITLPGHVRTAMMLIGGQGVSNDPALKSPLPPEDRFTVGMQKAKKGNGPGLHRHRTVEVFVALAGMWRLYWIDDEGECATEFNAWDVASIPSGVWRGLEVIGDEEGLLLAIRGGADGGDIEWHSSIIEEAAKHGRTLDNERRLVTDDRA